MSLYATDSNGKLHKIASNGIGDISVVDAQLDIKSTNPVQNKVLYNPVSFAESERLKSKNLFDINDTRTNTNGSSAVSNNTLNVKGTHAYTYTIYFVDVKPNTNYTVSANVEIITNNTNAGVIGIYNEAVSTGIDSFHPNNNSVVGTFNTGDNSKISVIFYSASAGSWSASEVNFSNIQLEEGTVATDYQSYAGGQIVRMGDIADVEHVETVYDKNSSDSAINWGYTSGLATNIDIQHNFNKYKKLLIYYVVKDGVYSFEKCFKMDLSENVSGVGFVVTQSEKNPYGWMADIAAFNEYYFVRCRVDSNKSLINVEFKKGTPNGISVSTVSEIYKIEGVY